MADSAAVAVVGKARARKPAAPRGAVAAGRKVLPRKRKGVVHRKGGIVLEDVSDEEGLREVDAVCAKEVAGFITGDDEIVPASDEEPEESLSASCGDSASSSSDSDDSDDDSDRVDGAAGLSPSDTSPAGGSSGSAPAAERRRMVTRGAARVAAGGPVRAPPRPSTATVLAAILDGTTKVDELVKEGLELDATSRRGEFVAELQAFAEEGRWTITSVLEDARPDAEALRAAVQAVLREMGTAAPDAADAAKLMKARRPAKIKWLRAAAAAGRTVTVSLEENSPSSPLEIMAEYYRACEALEEDPLGDDDGASVSDKEFVDSCEAGAPKDDDEEDDEDVDAGEEEDVGEDEADGQADGENGEVASKTPVTPAVAAPSASATTSSVAGSAFEAVVGAKRRRVHVDSDDEDGDYDFAQDKAERRAERKAKKARRATAAAAAAAEAVTRLAPVAADAAAATST